MTTFEKFIAFLTGNKAKIDALKAENVELKEKLSESEQAAIELRKISDRLDVLRTEDKEAEAVATDSIVDEGLPEQADADVGATVVETPAEETEESTEEPEVKENPLGSGSLSNEN